MRNYLHSAGAQLRLFTSAIRSMVLVTAITVTASQSEAQITLTQPVRNADLSTPEFHAYLSGAIWSVVLHEAAHALIDILDPLVTGPEEDAADEFAIILMLEEARKGTENAEEIITAYASAMLAQWNLLSIQLEHENLRLPDVYFWDEHSFDAQRAANVLCLLYGAFPHRGEWIVEELFAEELAHDPDAQSVARWRYRCPQDYARKREVWQRVLEPFTPSVGIIIPEGLFAGEFWDGEGNPFPSDPPGDRPIFRLEYADDEAPSDRYYESVVLRSTFETALAHLSHRIALPFDVPVILLNCEDANAFYSPEYKAIGICHELIDRLADVYVLYETVMGFDEWWYQARLRELPENISGYWKLDMGEGWNGPGVGEDIDLREDGGYLRWRYDYENGERVQGSAENVEQGLWGYTPVSSALGQGVIWTLTTDGFSELAIVSDVTANQVDMWVNPVNPGPLDSREFGSFIRIP